jgi:DNA-binding winged helix-turn-helix (wHTH) protein
MRRENLKMAFGKDTGSPFVEYSRSLIFDPATGEMSGPVGKVRLEPKAAIILAMLEANAPEMVGRDELLNRGWSGGEGSDESLTQAVAQVRRCLVQVGEDAEAIITYPKRGYAYRPKSGNPGAKRRHTFRPGHAALALILAVIGLVLWQIAAPHGLRHVVRHSLGIGPHGE